MSELCEGAGQERIVIKIGSNVLSGPDGKPNERLMAHLVAQVAQARQAGKEVILVSSGAVAFGRNILSIKDAPSAVETRQVLAATGQIRLMNTYATMFERHGLQCAQILVTKEDFRDRTHYLNMKNCLEALLRERVIPILNENDVVAVSELMFTDNDELAALITSQLNATSLIILTNVDGIYNGIPADPMSRVIEKISTHERLDHFITGGKSNFGRGGMLTKARMAQRIAALGITVHIANGIRPHIIMDVLNSSVNHSTFLPGRRKTGRKKWLAWSASAATATVHINAGASSALCAGAKSLLLVGVIEVTGDFRKGNIVRIKDHDGVEIGYGIARYDAATTRKKLGVRGLPPLIHYDYLYLNI